MPAGIMKRKKVFDCYKDKMIQLWPYLFSKLSFFTIKMSIDEIQVVIKSACYSMLLIYSIVKHRNNIFRVGRILSQYRDRRYFFFFVLRDWSKGQTVIHIPQSHSIGSSPTKKINISGNVTVKSALGFDLTLRYANNYSDTCTYTWYNPFPCIFYFPKSLVCALMVFH